MTVSALVEAIRSKQRSSEDITRAYLERIEAVNPKLNAVVHVAADSALRRARQADAALARGERWGVLHGVPVTIKDSFDVAGMPATAGTQGRAAHVPPGDATAVARLRAAGAVVLGKTNLPELSLAFETDNLVFGRTSNPYDPARTAGGSSGGEAAIVAAGGSPLGLGTDAAGSLRVPAHWCGVATIKPTHGRVPTTGIFPPALGPTAALWHVGPIARTVPDLALALAVLSGPDWRDPAAVDVPLGDPAGVAIGGLRVAVHADNGIMRPTPETVAAVTSAARRLADRGVLVTEERPAGIEQTFELAARVFALDGGAGVGQLLHQAGTTKVHPLLSRLGECLQPFVSSTGGDAAAVLAQWGLFKSTMLAFLERYDAILCPVNARPAVAHGTTLDDDVLPGFSYTQTYNLTGWPAVVVRAGTSPDGLPIGVQVIARPWRDDVALALARTLEETLGPWPAPAVSERA
jgi:amidase